MRAAILIACVALAGCGPMVQPIVHRLDPEEQKCYDDAWENMLAPPQRLDRILLLDVVLATQAYQQGIDRLRLASEKRTESGTVVMEVRFDREQPAMDEFTIRYLDRAGRELRRERYSREEVEDRYRFLYLQQLDPDFERRPDETEDDWQARREALEAARAARQEEIVAATRPAP